MLLEQQDSAGLSPKSKYFSEKQSTHQVAFRFIQQGINLILGQSNRGISQTRNEIEKFDEIKEVHTNLAQLRKQFDEYRNQSMIKEKEIQKYKNEENKLKLVEEQLMNASNSINQDLINIKNEFDKAKQRFEEIVMQKKSYNHIMNRLKHDLICFQLKYNQSDETLKQKLSNQQYIDFKQKQSVQYNSQTQKILDEMMKNIEMEHRTREDQLMMFKRQIKLRQEAERKRDERFSQQMDIAEHALYDKDANEGIVEAQVIVQKFLNKEQSYGDLLGKIATSEKKIDNLKIKNESFRQNYQKLKDEVQVMEMGKPSKKGLEADMYKELQIIDERAKKAEIMSEKLINWSIKMLQRFEKVQQPIGSQRTNFYEKYPKEQSIKAFEQVYQQINQVLQESKDDDIDRVINELNGSKFVNEINKDEFIKKNVRIKFKHPKHRGPKSAHSNTQSHESLNKSQSLGANSSGGGSYLESDEESFDENNEVDYIVNLRSDMKNNSGVAKKKKNLNGNVNATTNGNINNDGNNNVTQNQTLKQTNDQRKD